MGEPTSIKAKVYVPGKEKGGGLKRLLTLETVTAWIRLQGFDDYTTEGLIALASQYPTQALPQFRKNFNLMIERVRAKRKREINAQANKVAAERQHDDHDDQAPAEAQGCDCPGLGGDPTPVRDGCPVRKPAVRENLMRQTAAVPDGGQDLLQPPPPG